MPQLFHVVSRATSSSKQLAVLAALVSCHRISLERLGLKLEFGFGLEFRLELGLGFSVLEF